MVKTEAGSYKFICFTDEGLKLMNLLRDRLCELEGLSDPGKENEKVESLSDYTRDNFAKGNILVYIGAAGIAVRAIAPFIKDKANDPGVIVIDEKGEFVIPILSGHIGGAVEAAKKLSELIGATCVVTTATDVRGEFAIDVFAVKNNLVISSMKKAKEFTARLLKDKKAYYCADGRISGYTYSLPDNILPLNERATDINLFEISIREAIEDELILIPRCVVIGMGCKKGKSFDELFYFLKKCLKKQDIDIRAVKAIASIDIKKNEPGLNELAAKLNVPLITYSAERLLEQKGSFSKSEFVKSVTGVDNICERAVAACGCKDILMKKTAEDGMTISIGI